MAINMKEWISHIIEMKERVAIPIMTHPGIEYLGRTVKEAVTDGDIHAEAIKVLNNLYPSAACTVIMDLTVEAEAFGAEVIFPDNDIPTVTGRLVGDFQSVQQLEAPNMTKGRLQEYILANKLTADSIKDKPVLGGCIGPFSLAGRLYDMSELMMACYTEPETAKLLLSKCSSFLENYCLELKKQGIQGVVIAEPASGLLSNEGCKEFSSEYIKPVIETLQDEDFIFVLHNCGNKGHCTDAMLSTGASGYHFGNMMDMTLALEQCPEDVLVMGNLDPVTVFKNRSVEHVKTETMRLLENTKAYPNFVLSSGCDIPPHIPLENIEAFYDALNEFNKQNK